MNALAAKWGSVLDTMHLQIYPPAMALRTNPPSRISPTVSAAGLLLLAGLAGCGGGDNTKPIDDGLDSGEISTTVEVNDFELTLRILLPLNQGNLFDDVARLDVVILQDGAEVERTSLEALQRGEVERAGEGLPSLDGAVVALEGFDAEGALNAFGESAPLYAEQGASEASIFMARVDSFGWLYNLTTGSVGSALVADGQGDLLLFGGAPDGRPNERQTMLGTPSVRRLDLNQTGGGLEFATVGSMPTFMEDPEHGRAGHTATRMGGTHDDRDLILVAGGSTSLWDTTQVTDHAFLWDPSSDTVAHELTLSHPLNRHLAVADAAGNVVLSGGTTSADTNNTYSAHRAIQFYNAATRSVTTLVVPSEESQWIHHGVAAFGERGVLLCGGFKFLGDNPDFEDLDGCAVVSTAGTYTPRAETGIALPEARFHHGMIGLGDGRVLVAGGASYDDGAVTVSNLAWVLDPSDNSWTSVGPMHLGRALHAMTLLPDGRVLVAGGVTSLAEHWWNGGAAVSCAEIFNPDLGDFVEVGSCTSGSGDGGLPTQVAIPAIATEPTRGMAVVVGGLGTENEGSDGVSIYLSSPR